MKKVLKGSAFVLLYCALIVLTQGLAGVFGALFGTWKSISGINLAEQADLTALIQDVYAWMTAHLTILSFVADLLLLLSMLLVLKIRRISPKERFGNGRMGIKSVIGIVFLLFSLSVLIGILFALPQLSPYLEEHDEIVGELTGGNPLIVFLVVGIFGPIVEEIAFRGMIYKELRAFSPIWLSSLLSAAIFGAMHGNIVQSTYTFLAGILLALVYEKTNTLRAPVLLHILFNCSNFVPDFSGGAPIWAMIILVILGVFAGFRLIQKTPKA